VLGGGITLQVISCRAAPAKARQRSRQFLLLLGQI
jgi:hypothetical protein